MMKKFVSTVIAALMLVSAMTACVPAPEQNSASASADGIAKYTTYLENNLAEMPNQLVLSTAEDAETYGVDMTNFAADGYVTRADAGNVVIFGKTDAGLDRAVRDYVKYGNEDNYYKVYGEGYRVKKLTVAGNDISEYAIIRDDNADECNTYASQELAKYVELACGVRLDQFTQSEYKNASVKPQRTITLTVDYPALGEEDFTIEVGDDGNLTIYGGIWRGCMYGVYDLLEDMGWRFFFGPSVTKETITESFLEYVYESDHVDLTSAINRTESGSFRYRGHTAEAYGGVCDYSKYKSHNSSYHGIYGFALINVANHGLQMHHRDIFGETQSYLGATMENHQPCMTNEDILADIEAWALRFVQTKLNAGQTVGKELVCVDVAQWDNIAFCNCKTCLESIRETKAVSGAVVRMANRVAEAVNAENPGIYVKILAYFGSNKPPVNCEVNEYVRVSYCYYVESSNMVCTLHGVSGEDCASPNGVNVNATFTKEFLGWSELCTNNNLDVWYYPFVSGDCGYQPPIFTAIYDSMQFFAEHGVSNVYCCNYSSSGTIIHSLVHYLCARMMWDVDMSFDEYMAYAEEWFNICYGDAGDELFTCFTIMEQNNMAVANCSCTFHGSDHKWVDFELTSASFGTFCELYELAVAQADSERQLEWVEKYMAGMLYIGVGTSYEKMYTNGTAEEREELVKWYTEVHRLYNKHNIKVHDPLGGTPEYAPTELDLDVNPLNWSTWQPLE